MALRLLRRCWRLVRAAAHIANAVVRVLVQFPFLDPRRQRVEVQRWSETALAIFNLRLVATLDEEVPPGWAAAPCLYVANHVSWLDVFAIWALADTRFVAKFEVARWPAIGLLAQRLDVIFIDRTRRSEAVTAGRAIAAAVAGGQSVCIFPEGTTTEGAALQPFRPALFQAAVDQGIGVQPIAITYLRGDGTRAGEAAYTGDMSLVQSMWLLSDGAPLQIHVAILQRQAAGTHSRREMANYCQAAIHRRLSGADTRPVVSGSTEPLGAYHLQPLDRTRRNPLGTRILDVGR